MKTISISVVVKWNGKGYSKNYITHADLVKGGQFDIWLQSTPLRGERKSMISQKDYQR